MFAEVVSGNRDLDFARALSWSLSLLVSVYIFVRDWTTCMARNSPDHILIDGLASHPRLVELNDVVDYGTFDPETGSVALVGRFLQEWAAMELALHNALGVALSIETIKLQILCSNLRFRDKTIILRTLVDISSFADAEKKSTKSKLKKLRDHATSRNMIAHAPFSADRAATGVEFQTVNARGKFELPNMVWTLLRFEQENRALRGYANFLDELPACFRLQPTTTPFCPHGVPPPMPRKQFSAALWHFMAQQGPPDTDQPISSTGAEEADA